MHVSGRAGFAAGIVFTLVVSGGTAVAATGGKLILGHSNSAAKTTTLTNTKGTALSLESRAGTPALKVNRTTKVTNLNADLLDGLSSGSFARSAGGTNYRVSTAPASPVDLDGDGTDDWLINVASCPAKTVATGGGVETDNGDTIVLNAPLDGTDWVVASNNLDADPNSLLAYVMCYSPSGKVADQPRLAPRSLSMRAVTTLLENRR